MRIISGKCRGKLLDTLDGDNTRPTADRVKESVFNILGNRLFEKRILDLFAGSGALGLESLSRDAAFCDFVDSSKEAMKIINSNIEKCKMKEQSATHLCDYKTAVSKLKDKNFDVVFLDPPYSKDIGIEAINMLDGITNEESVVILETDEKDDVPDKIDGFEKYNRRRYGRTVVSFFRKEGF